MSNRNIFLEIERDDDVIEVEVIGEIYGASCGSRDAMGLQMEPDEPADCEILTVTGPEGESYTLTAKEEAKARKALFDAEADAWRYRDF